MIHEETNPTKFQVVINGVPYGAPQPSRMLADMLLTNLTPDQRLLAEVRPVTQGGKEILFG